MSHGCRTSRCRSPVCQGTSIRPAPARTLPSVQRHKTIAQAFQVVDVLPRQHLVDHPTPGTSASARLRARTSWDKLPALLTFTTNDTLCGCGKRPVERLEAA